SMKSEFVEQFRVLEASGHLNFYDVYRACIVVREESEARLVIRELEEFLAVDPSDRRSRLALSEELRRLDRLSEADRLLAVLPESDPSVRARRAQLMLDRGDLTTAEAILSTGPAGDSNFAPLRGRLALANRDPAAAVREFRIAVAAYPHRRDVLS